MTLLQVRGTWRAADLRQRELRVAAWFEAAGPASSMWNAGRIHRAAGRIGEVVKITIKVLRSKGRQAEREDILFA